MRNPRNDTLARSSSRDTGAVSASGPASGPASAAADGSGGHGIAGPVRSCILTRGRDSAASLVRLALSPDGLVLPDVRAKAPGRGAWIAVTRDELATAQAKGRLRGALARAFKGATLTIPDDLPARVEAALERNALDRLGLEARGGTLLTGSDRIEQAARGGQLQALYHAADASDDGMRRLAQAWRVGSGREGSDLKGLALPVGRTILALALGRENVVHIALTDRLAGKRVGEALDRWLHFIGPQPARASAQADDARATAQPAPCETAPQGASAPASERVRTDEHDGGSPGRDDDDIRGF